MDTITYRMLEEHEIQGRDCFVVVSSTTSDFTVGETFTDDDMSMAGSTGRIIFQEFQKKK